MQNRRNIWEQEIALFRKRNFEATTVSWGDWIAQFPLGNLGINNGYVSKYVQKCQNGGNKGMSSMLNRVLDNNLYISKKYDKISCNWL